MGLLVLSDVTEVASHEEIAAGRLDDDKVARLAAHMSTYNHAPALNNSSFARLLLCVGFF